MGAVLKLTPEEFEEKLAKENYKIPGIIKGHECFNLEGKLVGYVKGEEVYTASHFKVAYAKIGNIYNNSNKKMISLDDAKKVMNCSYEGVKLAAFWYFFRPKK